MASTCYGVKPYFVRFTFCILSCWNNSNALTLHIFESRIAALEIIAEDWGLKAEQRPEANAVLQQS